MEYNDCILDEKGLDIKAYLTILEESHIIAFEYDPESNTEWTSPYIGKFLAGNYDGRLLSQVMLQDEVIYPDDLEKALEFREQVFAKEVAELTLRLLTPQGDYRWFRMVTKSGGRQNCVGILLDVDGQTRNQEFLRHQAKIDPISGIYHRNAFLNKVQVLLEKERDRDYYLFIFDIDRFKLVNELFGTDEGNRVLEYIGNILRNSAKKEDIYGRLRDDYFCMCTDRNRGDTIKLIEEISREITKYPLAFRFFLPVGIVDISRNCQESADMLRDKARLAQCKIKGNYLRNYSFYRPEIGIQLNREHILIAGMEKALQEHEFEIFFQPQYNMQNGRIIGAEALARWRHPNLGMISPAEFIPLFEHNGLIVKLDEYIWDLACRTLRDWLDRGISAVPVSVNVSRVHLYDVTFCNKIVPLCEQYSIPHSLIELEITESAYANQPQELFPAMDVLRQAGFVFAMDDFGSGYSSFNILKDIPINTVKLDLRFLEKARRGELVGNTIVKYAVQLMNELNLIVLAEGVETREQASFLQEIGCRYAQGFYYAKPMPLDEFEQLLIENQSRN